MTKPLRLLRLPAVSERTGLQRDTVYRLIRQGRFPKPVKISERASGWVEAEVEEYLAQRIAARTPIEPAQ